MFHLVSVCPIVLPGHFAWPFAFLCPKSFPQFLIHGGVQYSINRAWWAHNQPLIIKIIYYCQRQVIDSGEWFTSFFVSYQEIRGYLGNPAITLPVTSETFRGHWVTNSYRFVRFKQALRSSLTCSITAISTNFTYKQVLLPVLEGFLWWEEVY